MAFAAAVVLIPAAAQAQAIEAWVQRYNGPGNGDDWARGVAVHTNGNIYVIGTSYGSYPPDGGSGDDWLTIAYSSAGVPLWTNRCTGLNGYQDNANAVAVDRIGYVYVTGSAIVASGDSRCTTIKYSATGVPMWTNIHSAQNSGGKRISLDADGNVFVAGTVYAPGNSVSLTIKLSSAGTLLWAKTYTGAEYVAGMAVDGQGSVIVAAWCDGSFGRDYLTLKYSTSGTLLWARRYTGPPDLDDPVQAVAVDAFGDVYVTGSSDGGGGDWDYATVKYSSVGVPLWTNRYDGPGDSRSDWGRAAAVDVNGNVVVTGLASGYRCATLKYSSDGIPLWTNLHTAGDAYAIATDSRGNIYVTGNSEGGLGNWDYLTVAYSSAGMPLWTNRYNGPGNAGDVGKAVVVDSSGGVYVTGYSAGSGNGNDYATVKYVVPPIITQHPLSRTNAVGTTATFSVEAVGGLPLGYQWRRAGTNLVDGGNLCGVTTTNLQISNVQLADACGCCVVVTNAYGSTTSHVAQLTVVSVGRFSNLTYSPVSGFSFVFRDATVGQPYRIQRSPSLAGGSWVDWMNFTYTEPTVLTDFGATTTSNRFYRAISP